METLVATRNGDEYSDEHYHDARKHGIVWAILNEMLHLIVLGYTVFGMIRFKVKFIKMVKFINWITMFIIAHSWYLSIKFSLITIIMYFFNIDLDNGKIVLEQLGQNCSPANHDPHDHHHHHVNSSPVASSSSSSSSSSGGGLNVEQPNGPESGNEHNLTLANYLTSHRTLMLANALDYFGGPYKFLGNRATLMYGFYAIAIYIMLAIFPIELRYLSIRFNYIRFVLNDTTCLRDLYLGKQKHLDRMNNWSRNKNSSILTLSMKKTSNQRNLRCLYINDRDRLAERLIVSYMSRHPGSRSAGEPLLNQAQVESAPSADARWRELGGNSLRWLRGKAAAVGSNRATNLASSENKVCAPVKSLRHSLSTNHLDQPAYSVRVANNNLRKFKPHVRSEIWFKISMVVYPIFVSFYFVSLIIVMGAISIYFERSLSQIYRACEPATNQTEPKPQRLTFHAYHNQQQLIPNNQWSIFNHLTHLETQYAVFILSWASSFYCSYYFGTLFELRVWIEEIAQQLNLCKLVLELIGEDSIRSLCHLPPMDELERGFQHPKLNAHYPGPPPGQAKRLPLKRNSLNSPPLSFELEDNSAISSLFAYHNLDSNQIDRYFNQFGGIRDIWSQMEFNQGAQSSRLKGREMMALRLISKKQTLLRATYINLNLFFDELIDTRFMIQTILRRTTQMGFLFAVLASLTHSQFESNYLFLTILLVSCLTILNLYLICAASINSGINWLLPQIHALISASLHMGTDHDLLEFWLRHIEAYGTDKDAMSYKIYGYKINWSSILNFNGAVTSAYLFTIY